MVKQQVSWTIDVKIIKKLRDYKDKNFPLQPNISESAVAEILLRQALAPSSEIAVENLP